MQVLFVSMLSVTELRAEWMAAERENTTNSVVGDRADHIVERATRKVGRVHPF